MVSISEGRPAMLEVKKLEVVYHRAAIAIQGVSFRVQEGSIVALLGVNGAGKTTSLRAVSGFLGLDNAEITDGSVEFLGERIDRKPPHVISRKGLILVPERQKVFETLTVRENLLVAGGSPGLRASSTSWRPRPKDSTEQILEYFPVLRDKFDRVAGYLSGGERQMLALAKALLCSPKLLMVDEFSLGIAPIVVDHLARALTALRKDLGLTILIVEQNAAVALAIADYGYIMENGRIVMDGTPEKLVAHEDVREFYLGMGQKSTKSYREVKQYRRTRRWW